MRDKGVKITLTGLTIAWFARALNEQFIILGATLMLIGCVVMIFERE